jgi:hypothetical protein
MIISCGYVKENNIGMSRDQILRLNFIGRKIICKYFEEGKQAKFAL